MSDWTHLGSETRVAAKRYQCYYCGESIQRGERHGTRTGVSDNSVHTMRFHPECDALACATWDEGDWECHEPGDFQRPMTAFDPCI